MFLFKVKENKHYIKKRKKEIEEAESKKRKKEILKRYIQKIEIKIYIILMNVRGRKSIYHLVVINIDSKLVDILIFL